MSQDLRTIFNAKYYREAGKFTSKEQSRYVLVAIRIEPHPEQGAWIVGTDGHTMGIFHDKYAECAKACTIYYSEDVAAFTVQPGTICIVVEHDSDDRAILVVTDSTQSDRPHAYGDGDVKARFTRQIVGLGGQFPDWRSVINTLPTTDEHPQVKAVEELVAAGEAFLNDITHNRERFRKALDAVKPNDVALQMSGRSDLNPEYLSRVAELGPERHLRGFTIWAGNPGSSVTHARDIRPAVLCVPEREDFVALVMPMLPYSVSYPTELLSAVRQPGIVVGFNFKQEEANAPTTST